MDEQVVQLDEGGNAIDVTAITRQSQQWRAAVYARLGTTSKNTTDIQTFQRQEFAEMRRQIRRLQEQVRTLAYAPARRAAGVVGTTLRGNEIRVGVADQGQDTRPATLCSQPKMLAVLWEEWQNGVGGRLPAKLFTPVQRGRCKALYCQRKVFWDCMERQIDNGCTVSTALARIDRIYSGTITQKLSAMRKDERRGGHNQLCPISVNERRRRGSRHDRQNRGQ